MKQAVSVRVFCSGESLPVCHAGVADDPSNFSAMNGKLGKVAFSVFDQD